MISFEDLWQLTQNLRNFILVKMIFVKKVQKMDFDLGTSRLYTENKGKNQACPPP